MSGQVLLARYISMPMIGAHFQDSFILSPCSSSPNGSKAHGVEFELLLIIPDVTKTLSIKPGSVKLNLPSFVFSILIPQKAESSPSSLNSNGLSSFGFNSK